MKTHSLFLAACAASLVAGCASGPPPTAEFPAGAKTPSAAEITAALRGKSFTVPSAGSTIRTDYAGEGNSVATFAAGHSDTGTWRAEDGRICYTMNRFPSACNDVRLVGNDIFAKRANGEVVQLKPR